MATDTLATITFAREQGLLLAIRGGGHNGPGLGTVEGGVVLDLGPMHGVRVDPGARTARVEGGATLGDVHHATEPFGLALPPASSPPPASAASPSAAGWAISPANWG